MLQPALKPKPICIMGIIQKFNQLTLVENNSNNKKKYFVRNISITVRPYQELERACFKEGTSLQSQLLHYFYKKAQV